jgi:hypothetical protein
MLLGIVGSCSDPTCSLVGTKPPSPDGWLPALAPAGGLTTEPPWGWVRGKGTEEIQAEVGCL